jgi:LytS/YehU family sensor histidine kinase
MTWFSIGLFIIGIILAGFLPFCFWKWKQAELKIKENEPRIKAMEQQLRALELNSLESHLNPHLFKNILNSIQSHAYQTYYAMDKLAGVLDYILYESRKSFVTPKEEIEFAKNLIEINKIKVSPLFDLTIKIVAPENEPFLTQQLLAPLICIDLIENAFKHADLQSKDAFITVHLELKNNCFLLRVTNKISDKTPLKKEKSGFGLSALEKRLHLIYANCYSLKCHRMGEVYNAQLTIDLFEHKTLLLAAR